MGLLLRGGREGKGGATHNKLHGNGEGKGEERGRKGEGGEDE